MNLSSIDHGYLRFGLCRCGPQFCCMFYFVVSFRNIFVLVSRVAESTLTVCVCVVFRMIESARVDTMSCVLNFAIHFVYLPSPSLPLSHTQRQTSSLFFFLVWTQNVSIYFFILCTCHIRAHTNGFFFWYPLRFDIVIELLFDSFRWFCTFDSSVVGVGIVVAAKAATQRQQHQPQILLIVRPLNYTSSEYTNKRERKILLIIGCCCWSQFMHSQPHTHTQMQKERIWTTKGYSSLVELESWRNWKQEYHRCTSKCSWVSRKLVYAMCSHSIRLQHRSTDWLTDSQTDVSDWNLKGKHFIRLLIIIWRNEHSRTWNWNLIPMCRMHKTHAHK